MAFAKRALAAALLLPLAAVSSQAQTVRSDPLTNATQGVPLELVHLFEGQWPTGIAVSSTGRKFTCYPGGLDPTNVNQGIPGIYTVGEITSPTTEVAYPNISYNTPPGGAVDYTTVPPKTKGLSNYLLGVQSVVVDELDTLWILDTGRVISLSDPLHAMLASQPGGPKLIAVNITSNTVMRTYTFPADVALPYSYLNDVRFDRSPSLSGINGTKGVAYITDSSVEGYNAIIVVDLTTGQSWRRLAQDPRTHAIPGTVPFVYGAPMYQVVGAMVPTDITFGADGIALSPDGATLYWSVIAGRFLYSVPTALLRARGSGADAAASAAVKNLGEKGISDGMETDSLGHVYAGNVEQDAISFYDPVTNFTTIYSRDPRINWLDTMSVATDGYLYFTVNQLNDLFAIYPGTGPPFVDRRQRPFAAFRVPLPPGATKIAPGGLAAKAAGVLGLA